MISKSQLAIILSKLKVFDSPDLLKEQYPTDSEISADFLWKAYMNGDINNKTIADFGCGTGIFGIGCLLLGAKKVYFVDFDSGVLEILKKNLEFVEEETSKNFGKKIIIVNKDVSDFDEEADVVMQNPPFGTKKRHADKEFLEKAMKTAKTIYSFHKPQSINFISKLSEHNKFKITHIFRYCFPLKKAFAFHKKRVKKIEVACWRMEREA